MIKRRAEDGAELAVNFCDLDFGFNGLAWFDRDEVVCFKVGGGHAEEYAIEGGARGYSTLVKHSCSLRLVILYLVLGL